MYYLQSEYKTLSPKTRDRRGRDRIVVGFITTYVISFYHH
jgi:hypothetical protein